MRSEIESPDILKYNMNDDSESNEKNLKHIKTASTPKVKTITVTKKAKKSKTNSHSTKSKSTSFQQQPVTRIPNKIKLEYEQFIPQTGSSSIFSIDLSKSNSPGTYINTQSAEQIKSISIDFMKQNQVSSATPNMNNNQQSNSQSGSNNNPMSDGNNNTPSNQSNNENNTGSKGQANKPVNLSGGSGGNQTSGSNNQTGSSNPSSGGNNQTGNSSTASSNNNQTGNSSPASGNNNQTGNSNLASGSNNQTGSGSTANNINNQSNSNKNNPSSDISNPSSGNNDSSNSSGSSSGGGSNISKSQLENSMKKAGYQPNGSYLTIVLKEVNSVFKDKNMAAMYLAQLAHESGWFKYIEEIACKQGCPRQYGSGASGKSYHGRGFIQLSWPDNYKAASQGLGMGNKLYDNPEIVASDPNIGIKTSTWFWKNRVENQPGVKGGKKFGLTTKAINGPLECSGGGNVTSAKKRYSVYKILCEEMGIKDIASEGGCY